MNVCLPIQEGEGAGATVSGHFGKAPAHVIVALETGELIARSEAGCGGGHQCAPIDWMLENEVKLVLCRSMGRGALQRLQGAGVAVAHTPHETVGEALAAFREGQCMAFGDQHMCS